MHTIIRLSVVLCIAIAVMLPTFGRATQATDRKNGNMDNKSQTRDEASIRARAEKLHRESIVVDTHNDITTPITDEGFDLGMDGTDPKGKTKTHTDLRRMKAGGLDAEFFAIYIDKIYVNKPTAEGGGSARRALDMISLVDEQVKKHSDVLEAATTADDIRRIAKKGKIAALMGIEGGHAIEDSLHVLRMFYKLGVRYMTLTHTNTNNWADSEADLNNPNVKHHNGLTDFGRDVVREMNRLGMMVDISHVADKTFYDVIETTKSPVIASHSSCRALANHTRNMTDDMLRAVAKNNGVVMINFYDGFLDSHKADNAMRRRTLQDELTAKYPNDAKRVNDEMAKWNAANPIGVTPFSVLMEHFVHVIKVAGIDHVGIGSDFDGVPGLPQGMEDISKLPNITIELMKLGYSDADIKKVLGENLLRVMAQNERIAREIQASEMSKK